MSFKVGIHLDDLESYHTSGEFLHGKVLLDVSRRTTLSGISMRVVCDVNSSIEVNVADPDKKPKVRIFTTKEQLYNKEVNLRLDQHHFEEGHYDLPFEFPLPLENEGLPPSATTLVQPNTFGNINYNLKVQAKRAGSSWFSSNKEGKAVVPFLFMPSGIGNTKYQNKAREEPFAGLVPGSDAPAKKKGLLASVLGRKGEPRPPLELKGVFSYSLPGIVQGERDNFGLRVQAGNPDENIMITGVSLYLETILVLTSKGNRRQQVIKSDPLVQEKLLRSGNSFNLDEVMAKALVLSSVVPTFDTSVISYRHQVLLELLLLRPPNTTSSDILKFTQEIAVRVLPAPVNSCAPNLPARPQKPLPVEAAPSQSGKQLGNGLEKSKDKIPLEQQWPREKQAQKPSSPTTQPDPPASTFASNSQGPSSSNPSSGPSPRPSSHPAHRPSSSEASTSEAVASREFVPVPDPSHGLHPDLSEPNVPLDNPPDYHEATRE